jgi:signal transduction histidine kinase
VILALLPTTLIDVGTHLTLASFLQVTAVKATALTIVASICFALKTISIRNEKRTATTLRFGLYGSVATITGGFWIDYWLQWLEIRAFISIPRLLITAGVIGFFLLPGIILLSAKQDSYRLKLRRARLEYQREITKGNENSNKAERIDNFVRATILEEINEAIPTLSSHDQQPAHVLNDMHTSIRTLIQNMERFRKTVASSTTRTTPIEWMRIHLASKVGPVNRYIYSSALLITAALVIFRDSNLNQDYLVFSGFLLFALISRYLDYWLGNISLQRRIIFELTMVIFGAEFLYWSFVWLGHHISGFTFIATHPHFLATVLITFFGIAFLSGSLELASLRYDEIYQNLDNAVFRLKAANIADAQSLINILEKHVQHLHGTVQTNIVSAALARSRQDSESSDQGDALIDLKALLTQTSIGSSIEFTDLADLLEKVTAPWRGLAEFTSTISPESEKIPPDNYPDIYSLLEEAVANSIRHGRATLIEITIALESSSGLLCTVKDNGTNPITPRRGLGSDLYDRITGGNWSLQRIDETTTHLELKVKTSR